MGEIAALDAEINGAKLTLAGGYVEEVVKEFIASHTALVTALEAEINCTFLEECVSINPGLPISCTDKVLAISTELNMKTRPIKSLEFNKGTIGYAEQVGLLISGHCYQLLAYMGKSFTLIG